MVLYIHIAMNNLQQRQEKIQSNQVIVHIKAVNEYYGNFKKIFR